jgi:ribosomal protein S27AE
MTTPKPLRSADAPSPDSDETTCPRCGESQDLAKVKGCIKCLKCGFKFDCNGW